MLQQTFGSKNLLTTHKNLLNTKNILPFFSIQYIFSEVKRSVLEKIRYTWHHHIHVPDGCISMVSALRKLLFGSGKRRIIEPKAFYPIIVGYFYLFVTPVIVVISLKLLSMTPVDVRAFLLLLMSPLIELMKINPFLPIPVVILIGAAFSLAWKRIFS